MNKENRAYIVQLVKQIVHPYFAEEIADILIAHGMTFKTEPQTNADRIRAMSDEELAEDCVEIILNVMELLGIKNTGRKEEAVKARLEWLQQPAEEVLV